MNHLKRCKENWLCMCTRDLVSFPVDSNDLRYKESLIGPMAASGEPSPGELESKVSQLKEMGFRDKQAYCR